MHFAPLGTRFLDKIVLQIAAELKVRPAQVQTAVELLDGGATVPFIARYRKEATDGLDDIQLRELEARLGYLRELEERRAAVLKSIDEQGKLTPELRAAVEAAPTKQELEDLYLPYKPKRRTKGMIAREAGLEPLADRLFADPTLDPLAEAAAFVNAEAGFADAPAVLDGVRDILSERWAEDAALVGKLREWLWAEGLLQSQAGGRQGRHARRRRQVPRLLRLRRADPHACRRTARWRCSAAARRSCWTPSWCSTKSSCPASPSLAEGRIARPPGLEPRQARRPTT